MDLQDNLPCTKYYFHTAPLQENAFAFERCLPRAAAVMPDLTGTQWQHSAFGAQMQQPRAFHDAGWRYKVPGEDAFATVVRISYHASPAQSVYCVPVHGNDHLAGAGQ